MCVFFLLPSHVRLSFLSVVFDFNASLNDIAPLSPITFPVNVKRKEKSELLMDVLCVFFRLCSQPRLSSMSVVFDFNASLNVVAPVDPMFVSMGYQCCHSFLLKLKECFFVCFPLLCLTSKIEALTRNNVHRKCNLLNCVFFLEAPWKT